jgi:hypothetical protein
MPLRDRPDKPYQSCFKSYNKRDMHFLVGEYDVKCTEYLADIVSVYINSYKPTEKFSISLNSLNKTFEINFPDWLRRNLM